MIRSFVKFGLIILLLTISPIVYAGYCGDGVLDSSFGEQCDDGNFTLYDGCDSYCKTEDLTAPTVVRVSIPNNSTGIPTTTRTLEITFSEPLDPSTITPFNIYLEKDAKKLDFRLTPSDDNTRVSITINQDLDGDSRYALHIINVKDSYFSVIDGEYISVFDTGSYIDQTPPNVVAQPSGGNYNVAQAVTINPYDGQYTGSDEFIDETATVYYTLDGSIPTTSSAKFGIPIIIKNNTTLKFFGVDSAGNASAIGVENYTFSCADTGNIKEVTSYPECTVIKCNPGFILRNNVCVASLATNAGSSIEDNAVNAPLFGSDTPMIISSKPAVRILPEHNGVIPRPLTFKDPKSGMVLNFDRSTKIRELDGTNFEGLITTPKRLFSKDFPTNFGYVFKSILKFDPSDSGELTFFPSYKLTIPYGDNYNPDKIVKVFIYDPSTEQYYPYNSKLLNVDLDAKKVTITSNKSNIFFIAQASGGYSRAAFNDMDGHWARNYAESLHRRGIVKGKSKGRYAPDDFLTRAEFTKIAINAIGAITDDPETIEDSPFRDVSAYAWYTPYIKKAKEIGLIAGYPDGNFRPERQINRAEAIHILIKAFGFDLTEFDKPSEQSNAFKDVLSDQWYFSAMNFVIKNKFLDGLRTDDDSGFLPDWYGPDKPITRGEMAKLATKVIEFSEKSGSN